MTLCPNCRAENVEEGQTCFYCGTQLTSASKSLVPVRNYLPTVLRSPQLPRVAASVGAVVVGVGVELLRRSLLARATRSRGAVSNPLPLVNRLRETLLPQNEKTFKLPKNYEIQETVVYIQRVIRRKEN